MQCSLRLVEVSHWDIESARGSGGVVGAKPLTAVVDESEPAPKAKTTYQMDTKLGNACEAKLVALAKAGKDVWPKV